MATPDEIRSTEKLLDLIRKPASGPTNSGNPPGAAPSTNVGPTPPKRSMPFKRKKCAVGVDIGHSYLRFAKAVRQGDRRYELVDYLHIPLLGHGGLSDPQLLKMLKEGLDRICGADGQCDIWSAIASAQVEVRYLRVPKLKKKQMANAIFWTFTNKVAFNEQEEILDYEILGDITEGGVRKTEVMAFKAPKTEVTDLKEAFTTIGYPLKGITIVPFAIQNLLRAGIVGPDAQDVCCLFVGRDWSRIAIYSNGNLMLSRGIKAGMRSMVEAIDLHMRDMRGDAQWSDDAGANGGNAPGASNADSAVTHPAAQKAFFDFLSGALGIQEPTEVTVATTAGGTFQMILPAMERLIRQVERTLEHYALHFQREKVKHLFLSGQITANEMVVNHIAHQLELSTDVMNPFAPATPFTDNVTVPESRMERESYLPAIGLAIAHNSLTPNFLHTHKDKDAEEGLRRFNQRILIGCMACLLALLLVFSWQERQLDAKRASIAQLNARLLGFNPPAEREILLALFSQNQKRHQELGRLAHRYAPVAMLQELADITPAHIRLIGIEADFSQHAGQRTTAPRTLSIDGIIFGDPGGLETALTSYLLSLRNSPVFSRPAVQSRRVEYYNAQEVLRFQARVEIP